MIVYKIVLVERDELRTLFHGINRSRILPVNKWIKAEKRYGRDGSGQNFYLTGIHCFKDEEVAIEYLNKFRIEKNRVIIECEGRGLRQKPSNKDVFLADEIFIRMK